MSKSPSKFCALCPRRLNRPPTEPCTLGLEYVEAQLEGRRGDKEERGCPWGITSAQHGYCFWTYVHANSDEDGRMDPVPDGEICALLGISQSLLEKTLTAAQAKLRAAKDSPEMQEFRRAVLERAAMMPDDNTVYMPDNFRVEIPEVDPEEVREELPEELLDKPKRRMNSMPLHRDGRKTDLFGIYSKKRVVKK